MVKFHDDIHFAKAELTCIFIDAKVTSIKQQQCHTPRGSSPAKLLLPVPIDNDLVSCARAHIIAIYHPWILKHLCSCFNTFTIVQFTTLESVLQILQLVLDLTSRDSAKLHSRYPTREPLSLCYRYPRSAAARYGRRRCCQL